MVPVASPKPVLAWKTPSNRGMERMEVEYSYTKWVTICKEYGIENICVPIRYAIDLCVPLYVIDLGIQRSMGSTHWVRLKSRDFLL